MIHLRCFRNIQRNTSVPTLKTTLFYFISFHFMLNTPAFLNTRETEVRVQKLELKKKFRIFDVKLPCSPIHTNLMQWHLCSKRVQLAGSENFMQSFSH